MILYSFKSQLYFLLTLCCWVLGLLLPQEISPLTPPPPLRSKQTTCDSSIFVPSSIHRALLIPVMAATCETRNLSSLEALLLKLQQSSEEQHGDEPPALPARPVVKSRLPRARKKLPLNFHISSSTCRDQANGKVNGLFESRGVAQKHFLEADGPDEISISGNESELEILKGVEIIQRCYHGHQAQYYYQELRRGAISLQSFVRGESVRKDYQDMVIQRTRAIAVIQKHIKEQRNKRLEQLRATICLQSGIRGWLTRREFNKKMVSYRNSSKQDEHNKMLVDLQRKLATSEAALAKSDEENASLKKYISECDKKLEDYETKMQSMEKMWQDQLIALKTSLAAVNRSQTENGTSRIAPLEVSEVRSDGGGQLVSYERLESTSDDNGVHHQVNDVKKPKAWFKSRLQGVKAALKQLRYGSGRNNNNKTTITCFR
ncbi:unnamed protein product [Cuscuta epithymum]|uniref:Uncharacterized protein n=1 Tax=Cuscuta epithymum TaxID=186058 RepID=A0AAV0G198_9ASTE|nr:unnamed protein product [Cuscuta epithymum]